LNYISTVQHLWPDVELSCSKQGMNEFTWVVEKRILFAGDDTLS